MVPVAYSPIGEAEQRHHDFSVSESDSLGPCVWLEHKAPTDTILDDLNIVLAD